MSAMRVVRAALTGFLLVLAFALSFGVLRHRAIEAGIIHGALGTILWGGLSVHTQAGMWALGPDVLAAVGIVGVRIDRKDPRAWVALILGLGLTLTFQVWDHPTPLLLRAVPAVAGAMAVWMMEIPWNRPAWESTPLGHPVPEPAQPAPAPDPVPEPDQPEPERTRPRVAQGAARRERPVALGRPFTAADHGPVRAWVDQGRTNKAEMARELGLHKRGQLELGRYVNQYRSTPAQVGHPNGQGGGS